MEAGGGGEIRTHEAFRPSGFQDRRNQPLCHPSGEFGRENCAITGELSKGARRTGLKRRPESPKQARQVNMFM